jgi:hypothetical protein
MVSSTNPDALDDETKQRFLILTIDESPEQTKSILQAQITKNTHEWYQLTSEESSVLRLHHNMQRLLKPLTVTFTRDLRLVWPYSRLQMRREQQKFVSLVKAITLLHQYQRKTGSMKRADGGKMEYVQATQRDVDLALELGREVFARNVDDVSPTARKLLNGRQGSTFRYLLLDDGSADPEFCFGNEGEPKNGSTKNQLLKPESSPLRQGFAVSSPAA